MCKPILGQDKSYEVAEASDSLGGVCDVETCAQKLNKKVSGGFMMIISSAQKFGLIEFEKGTVTVTENFKLIKHSYSEDERTALLRKAFLSPTVFLSLYERFINRELPVKLLDKIMIREFGVDENVASRIAGYFIDGLKEFGLIDSENIVKNLDSNNLAKKETVASIATAIDLPSQHKKLVSQVENQLNDGENFFVHIYGPGINNKIKIDEEDDLLIVDAILKKIKKAVKGAE